MAKLSTADNKIIMEASAGCTSFLLRKMSRIVSRTYDEALRPSGLKSTQFSLLAAIHELSPLPPRDLKERIGLDKSSLSRNLKVLEREGLLRFGVSDDARERPVLLTQKGQRTLQLALPLWKAAQDHLQSVIGPDGNGHLQRLKSSIEEISQD